MSAMTLGPRGASLIKGFEVGPGNGPRLEAYLPTPDDVPTLAFGHTRGVKLGDTCTESQAEAWFLEDVAEAVAAVNRRASQAGWRLSQSMFDALVSLVFNVGEGAISDGSGSGAIGSASGPSTIWLCWKARDIYGMWRGFSLWIRQAHSPLRGLARRRAQEMSLYMEDPFL